MSPTLRRARILGDLVAMGRLLEPISWGVIGYRSVRWRPFDQERDS